MKKLIFTMLLAFACLAANAQCNTTYFFSSAAGFPWCLEVDANKNSDGLYPALVEFSYKTVAKHDTAYVGRGGFIATNTKICRSSNIPTNAFYNIGAKETLKVRTINFALDRLTGTSDPSSPYYNPFLGKTDEQIYNSIKGDPSKWCIGTLVTNTATQGGGKKK